MSKTSKGTFYVIAEPTTTDAYIWTDDNGAPKAYDTETEAVDAAKEAGDGAIVVKAVARVKETHRTTIEKLG